MVIKGFNYGIKLYNSSNVTISRNVIEDNKHGIHLLSSSNNRISENTFINNSFLALKSYQNFVENNIVNGKPLVYLEGISNRIINYAGQVVLVRCKNIKVKNLDISKTDVGIELCETNNSIISGNNIVDNDTGIYLSSSSNNTISENNIKDNWHGIWLGSSSNNKIYRNNITENERAIRFYHSSNNIVSENNLTRNTRDVFLWNSSNNKFFYNNFIESYTQVRSFFSMNIWDDGYPAGGNYWSNYKDIDEKSGPNQDLAGSDGIWDHPYVIDLKNKDRYPLVKPLYISIPFREKLNSKY
jgi:parallel beta-helix repeat protein